MRHTHLSVVRLIFAAGICTGGAAMGVGGGIYAAYRALFVTGTLSDAGAVCLSITFLFLSAVVFFLWPIREEIWAMNGEEEA